MLLIFWDQRFMASHVLGSNTGHGAMVAHDTELAETTGQAQE